MRNLNRLLAFMLVVGLLLTVAHIISAQRQGGRRGRASQRQPGQMMDPQAMMERRIGRIMDQLNLSEEEAAVLKPKIEGILQTRLKQSSDTRELINALREAIDTEDIGEIKAKLTKLKATRKEHKAKAETLEKGLIRLLTVKQEAQLTLSGVVNSDGSGFRFGGFGGPGARNRPGRQQQR